MKNIGKNVFLEQAQALQRTAKTLGDEFEKAVDLVYGTKSRVIISGMGKSGIIGRKIAATFASTGTSAFFVHPAEAYHGDLGMFQAGDVAVLISYSGETEEVIRIIPWLKHNGIPIIAIVGNPNSTLGSNAQAVLDVSVEKEACPNNLAPTTSTTTTLVMGDALAIALIHKRDFQPQDFARFHPGGSLGKRLLTRVKDVMHANVPSIAPNDAVQKVIEEMTNGRIGVTLVTNPDTKHLEGVITDGDLRRALIAKSNIYESRARDIMSHNPKTVDENEMFATAETLMLKIGITSIVAINAMGQATGVLRLLDAAKVR